MALNETLELCHFSSDPDRSCSHVFTLELPTQIWLKRLVRLEIAQAAQPAAVVPGRMKNLEAQNTAIGILQF